MKLVLIMRVLSGFTRFYTAVVAEPFANTQAKLTLNLANNYIRDWSEKRTRTRPCLKMCRFCDRVVSEASRQWVRNDFRQSNEGFPSV